MSSSHRCTNFSPELQFCAKQLLSQIAINKEQLPLPVEVSEFLVSNNSFIKLLLCGSGAIGEEIEVLFRVTNATDLWPSTTATRLMIYSNSKIFRSSTEGLNLFNIEEEIDWLNAYKKYLSDSTSVILISDISATSSSFVQEGEKLTITSNINILEKQVSKLIFTYLNFTLNNDFSYCNDFKNITDENSNVSELFFEILVINEHFLYISSLGV